MKIVLFFNVCSEQNKKCKTLLHTLGFYFWKFYWPMISEDWKPLPFVINVLS